MLQPDNPPALEPSAGAEAFSHYPAIPPPVSVSLTTLPDHPCSYFPERTARSRAAWAARLPGGLYHQFMDAGFRRSGKVVYQPICAGCRACVPIRVRAIGFIPDKSQRRCWRKNQDVVVSAQPLNASVETYNLYRRYIQKWHGGDGAEHSPADFERFLCQSPVQSLEFRYRDQAGKLLAVGICDVSDQALSSVYFYFDPDASQRSLGTFGALFELGYAKEKAIEYYYLGYWIDGCDTMQYKNRFRPCELLGADGKWSSMD
jgi:leucyl-tRNA---protein transferase